MPIAASTPNQCMGGMHVVGKGRDLMHIHTNMHILCHLTTITFTCQSFSPKAFYYGDINDSQFNNLLHQKHLITYCIYGYMLFPVSD